EFRKSESGRSATTDATALRPCPYAFDLTTTITAVPGEVILLSASILALSRAPSISIQDSIDLIIDPGPGAEGNSHKKHEKHKRHYFLCFLCLFVAVTLPAWPASSSFATRPTRSMAMRSSRTFRSRSNPAKPLSCSG